MCVAGGGILARALHHGQSLRGSQIFPEHRRDAGRPANADDSVVAGTGKSPDLQHLSQLRRRRQLSV